MSFPTPSTSWWFASRLDWDLEAAFVCVVGEEIR